MSAKVMIMAKNPYTINVLFKNFVPKYVISVLISICRMLTTSFTSPVYVDVFPLKFIIYGKI